VQRLLDAGFTRPITYSTWLANMVIVTKIEVAINSMAGCANDVAAQLFLWLRVDDHEKTTFITPFGTYFFVRMPEELKNAGPTFCIMSRFCCM
jgi:hypothetical protein